MVQGVEVGLSEQKKQERHKTKIERAKKQGIHLAAELRRTNLSKQERKVLLNERVFIQLFLASNEGIAEMKRYKKGEYLNEGRYTSNSRRE